MEGGVAGSFLLLDSQSPSGTGVRIGWVGFILPLPSPDELLRGGIALGDVGLSETIVFAVWRAPLFNFVSSCC